MGSSPQFLPHPTKSVEYETPTAYIQGNAVSELGDRLRVLATPPALTELAGTGRTGGALSLCRDEKNVASTSVILHAESVRILSLCRVI